MFFYRDASYGVPVYTITIMDCLKAIQKAKEANFFNFEDFDYEEYEHYEKVQVNTSTMHSVIV
jgi:cell division cycle 14